MDGVMQREPYKTEADSTAHNNRFPCGSSLSRKLSKCSCLPDSHLGNRILASGPIWLETQLVWWWPRGYVAVGFTLVLTC